MRDLGFLVREFEPSFFQEMGHERLDLITKKFLRCACDQESSSPGEFHPQALTEPDVRLSPHPALITRPTAASPRRVPPNRLVDPTTRLGDWAPSLHAHYRHFPATTSPSAPV